MVTGSWSTLVGVRCHPFHPMSGLDDDVHIHSRVKRNVYHLPVTIQCFKCTVCSGANFNLKGQDSNEEIKALIDGEENLWSLHNW